MAVSLEKMKVEKLVDKLAVETETLLVVKKVEQ
jgi:hypothetical protein